MANQKLLCPHCRAKKTLCSHQQYEIRRDKGYFLYVCDFCEGPIVQLIEQAKRQFDYRRLLDVHHADLSVELCGWRVVDSWPKPQFREMLMPDGLPEPIKNLLEHSQEAASTGGYELSILGFVLALKMAKSTYSPEFKGSVRQWILALIEKGMLLSNMKTWINRLKLREVVVGASALLAEDYAAFVLTVLTQIFGMSSRSKGVAGGSR